MANFSVVNTTAIGAGLAQQACTTTYKSQILVYNSTLSPFNANFGVGLRRGKLFDLMVGTAGAPADNYMEWDIIRSQGQSTAAALAGQVSSISSAFALDTADTQGCQNNVTINASVETNIAVGAEVFYIGVNQRASYRWVAAPGSEIVWPANASATGNGGLVGRVRSGAYTGNCTMQWIFQEQ